MAGNLLELLLTWFKKYHLLFPNYTSAFISSFNCLYQRDHNVVPAAETLPSKCVKTCQILQTAEDCSSIAADSVPGRGGGVLGSILAGFVPLASPNPYPIIVYSVTNYRPHVSHLWANATFCYPNVVTS